MLELTRTRWVLGLLLCSVALFLTLLLAPLKENGPFILFIGATAVGSWYGGAALGLTVAGLSALAASYFILPPVSVAAWGGIVPLAAFAGVALLITWISQVVADRIGVGIEYAQLYRRAEKSNRLKDEFLATASHELRAPLTPILAWVSQLRRGTLDPAHAAHALEAIERNARAQARLVDDLLEVSRMISGKMGLDLKPVRLAEVIDAAIDAVRPAAMAKKIRVVKAFHQEVRPIRGDAQRLQQVAWNLLSNAIKFTPEHGRVEVQLAPADTHVELSVRDTGQGISPAFLPHVFERFRQGDASTRGTHGGLGLGLAIVRHIVELHGGSVRAESAGEGQGATFTVRLPLQVAARPVSAPARPPETQPPTAAKGTVPRLDGLRVLVVDDEPDTCQVLEAILRWDGAEVRASQSAVEALAALAGWWPDILLCDIGMPGEDGYALMRKIRARGQPPGHPLTAVALTAYARSEDRQQALSAGFQMHIPKPFDTDELVGTLATLGRRTAPN